MKNKIKYILFALFLLASACTDSPKQADTITPGMEIDGSEESSQSAPTLLPSSDEN